MDEKLEPQKATLKYSIGRWSDNELVLFVEERRESWILYPPRSAYDFINKRRPNPHTTIIEHHPWSPYSPSVDHPVQPRQGCLVHGMDCGAHEALQAAVDSGYDPFK